MFNFGNYPILGNPGNLIVASNRGFHDSRRRFGERDAQLLNVAMAGQVADDHHTNY